MGAIGRRRRNCHRDAIDPDVGQSDQMKSPVKPRRVSIPAGKTKRIFAIDKPSGSMSYEVFCFINKTGVPRERETPYYSFLQSSQTRHSAEFIVTLHAIAEMMIIVARTANAIFMGPFRGGMHPVHEAAQSASRRLVRQGHLHLPPASYGR